MPPAISLNPKLTAATLRTVLKRAFPATKFSVVTERGSMVSSVRISWTDGPTAQSVETFTAPFQAGHFDGMTDSYSYDAQRHLIVDGVAYKAQCRYIFTSRSISPKLANACIKQIAEFWGGVDLVPVAVEGYSGYRLEPESMGRQPVREDLGGFHNDWYTSIHRAACNRTEFQREG